MTPLLLLYYSLAMLVLCSAARQAKGWLLVQRGTRELRTHIPRTPVVTRLAQKQGASTKGSSFKCVCVSLTSKRVSWLLAGGRKIYTLPTWKTDKEQTEAATHLDGVVVRVDDVGAAVLFGVSQVDLQSWHETCPEKRKYRPVCMCESCLA